MSSDSDYSDSEEYPDVEKPITIPGLLKEWSEYSEIFDINAVRKWNEYIKHIPQSGPRGITLANTVTSNIHDPETERGYAELKVRYDELVGPPTVTEADKFDVFKKIYSQGSLKGYTFFPYFHDVAKQLFKKPMNPIVTSTGSIVTPYSHFVPSLLLQSVVPQVHSNHIDMHIICRGVNESMLMSDDMEHLMDSEVFLKASETPLVYRRLRRICIWIKTLMHVYVIVWDSISLSEEYDNEKVYHRCFSCNSASNENSITALRNLTTTLQDRTCAPVRNLGNLVDSRIVMTAHGGMMCTSFMARITLYLSMVANVPRCIELIRCGVSYLNNGNDFEAMVYRIFEYHLYSFVRDQTLTGNIVLFAPEDIYPLYIDANKVKLVVLTPDNRVYQVNYTDIEHGFQLGAPMTRMRHNGSSCIVSSRFPFQ